MDAHKLNEIMGSYDIEVRGLVRDLDITKIFLMWGRDEHDETS